MNRDAETDKQVVSSIIEQVRGDIPLTHPPMHLEQPKPKQNAILLIMDSLIFALIIFLMQWIGTYWWEHQRDHAAERHLNEIHRAEQVYFTNHQRFGGFSELLKDGCLAGDEQRWKKQYRLTKLVTSTEPPGYMAAVRGGTTDWRIDETGAITETSYPWH